MLVKIKKIKAEAKIPSYSYAGDAAFDLSSCEDHELLPGASYNFFVGIAMEIPTGYVGLVWDRSGLAAKNGLTCLGGVIDSGYRGEIAVTLYNSSSEPYLIKKGERIAQMLIQPVEIAEIVEAHELSESERGQKGHGSSGSI